MTVAFPLNGLLCNELNWPAAGMWSDCALHLIWCWPFHWVLSSQRDICSHPRRRWRPVRLLITGCAPRYRRSSRQSDRAALVSEAQVPPVPPHEDKCETDYTVPLSRPELQTRMPEHAARRARRIRGHQRRVRVSRTDGAREQQRVRCIYRRRDHIVTLPTGSQRCTPHAFPDLPCQMQAPRRHDPIALALRSTVLPLPCPPP